MSEPNRALSQKSQTTQIALSDAESVNRGESVTMMLDGCGRIINCGTPAARFFRTSQVLLKGEWISDLVEGLLITGAAPGNVSPNPVYHFVDGGWKCLEAKDAMGFRFPIELSLSRLVACEEIYLLRIRRVEQRT